MHVHLWQCLVMGVIEPRSIIYYMGEIVDELPAHLRKVASNVVQLADFRRSLETGKPVNKTNPKLSNLT